MPIVRLLNIWYTLLLSVVIRISVSVSSLCVLVLHRIVPDKADEWADVKLNTFVELLETLYRKQKIVTRIDNQQNNLDKICLSFDDGHASDFELVLPLLLKYNMKATFFITPHLIGREGHLSWNQVRMLNDAGMEIGSHSLSHPYLTTVSDQQLFTELKQSKVQIEQNIGKEIKSFAYPFGDYSHRTNALAKLVGYEYICTSKPGLFKAGGQIVKRNSVHSNTRNQDMFLLLNQDKYHLFRAQLRYSILYGLKRILGIKNYIKLKQFLYL